MAEAIAEGARSLKLDTDVVDAFNVTPEDVMAADAIGFGVPTFNYHAAKPILKLLDDLAGKNVTDKLAIVFGSYGWSGQAVSQMSQILAAMKIKLVHEGLQCKYIPTLHELVEMRALGERLARENLRL
jgi:flavorubredoxin